jgi:hypothetical protein
MRLVLNSGDLFSCGDWTNGYIVRLAMLFFGWFGFDEVFGGSWGGLWWFVDGG